MGKTVKSRDVTKVIDLYCRKTNGRVLKRLGSCLGANLGANKTGGRIGIVDQAEKLERLRTRKLLNGETSLTAIDAGVSNFAYSVFKWYKGDKFPTLVDWNKINLCQKFLESNRTKMRMDPSDTWQVGYGLVEMLTNKLETSDIYMVEKQRTRSLSSKNIVESVLLSNLMEHILFSNLRNKLIYGDLDKNYIVHSSNPQKMAQYWCDLKSLSTLYNRYKESVGAKNKTDLSLGESNEVQTAKTTKNIRINLVKTILKNATTPNDYQKCLLAPDWRLRVETQLTVGKKFKLLDCIGSGPELGAKKDDDLADSFLHGLAWMDWLGTYENVVDIIMKNDGAFHEDILRQFNTYCMSLNTEWVRMSPKMKGELAELNLDETMVKRAKDEKPSSVRKESRTSKL